eukprot:TRINITY_DN11118_c0_g1_i1.p1 TRINITY_DN11118_c0_g1~~TRINITY_DN11118_c0_g1_i1.p1  ORF type:complete len:383 (-),score=81.89 TRINITY_DN11118_c0_g1_i1:98-1075(-)
MNNQQNSFYVPVLNFPQQLFRLRYDCAILFKETGVNVDDLLFRDEIELDSLFQSSRLRLHLTDHNKLSEKQASFGPVVEEIIDHHADEKLYLSTTSKRVIESVGSATTLVSLLFLDNQDKLQLDQNLARILISPIIIDTFNFNPTSARGTPKDQKAASLLLKIAGIDQNSYYLSLRKKKEEGALSAPPYDILQSDYKEAHQSGFKIGFSSATGIKLKEWLSQDSTISALESFTKELDIQVLVLATSYNDQNDDLKRGLAVWVKEGLDDVRKNLVARLEDSDFSLELIDENGTIRVYQQLNVAATRKQIMPLVVNFFSSLTFSGEN